MQSNVNKLQTDDSSNNIIKVTYIRGKTPTTPRNYNQLFEAYLHKYKVQLTNQSTVTYIQDSTQLQPTL